MAIIKKFEARKKKDARIHPLWPLGLTLGVGAAGWLLWKARAKNKRPAKPNPPSPVPPPTLVRRDTVDEASWESFPASDPPGW